MDKTNIKTIYKLDCPVLSFDVFENKIIAVIYQKEGRSKLTVRNVENGDEQYYLDLDKPGTNVLVRFLSEVDKIIFFDSTKIFIVNLIRKEVNLIHDNVLDCCFHQKSNTLFFITKDGEIAYWRNSVVFNLKNELSVTRPVWPNGIEGKMLAYAGENEILIIAHPFMIASFSINNPQLIKTISIRHEFIKDLAVDDLCHNVGVIGIKPGGVYLYESENMMLDNSNIFFESLTNQTKIFFLPHSTDFLLVSNIGYISRYSLINNEYLFSTQVHTGCIRDIIYKEENCIYTGGDDGIIIQLFFK